MDNTLNEVSFIINITMNSFIETDDVYYDDVYDSDIVYNSDDIIMSSENDVTLYDNQPILGGTVKPVKNELITYDPYEFVSKCCKSFLFYDKLSIFCSKCGKEVDKIEAGKAVTISVKFNSATDEINMSEDILRAFQNSIPRFATDPTCELCERKCPICDSKTKYLRDCTGNMWYVCSNKDCRYVIEPSDIIQI